MNDIHRKKEWYSSMIYCKTTGRLHQRKSKPEKLLKKFGKAVCRKKSGKRLRSAVEKALT